ncbi:MAG: lipid-A-disaccharide synthase, partial [Spartobacteria bacterium]|nr:lipid-A-disaccharide synthase [Spartobacteria bacterium]
MSDPDAPGHPPAVRSRQILVVAGEVSGDMHAAKVVRALQRRDPTLRFWGIGGEELRACGVELLYDVRDMAVLGLTEVLKRYGFFRRVLHDMCRQAAVRKPDAVLLVDYPGFNLRLSKRLHRTGPKICYYVCPQIWAWHQSRKYQMAEILDLLLVIFPFEVEIFSDTGLRVEFVGHPLVEKARR